MSRARRALAAAVAAAALLSIAPMVPAQEAAQEAGEAAEDLPPTPPDPLQERAPERRPGADTLTEAQVDALTAEVAAQLRCPVCRNQSVGESSAELSREMQSVIRERLAAGHTPEEVKAYFVERYGEWILLRPEPKGINLAVYLLPALVLLGGAWLVRQRLRSWTRASPEPPPAPTEAAERGDGGAEEAEGEASEVASEPPLSGDLAEEDERWLERALREG